MRPIRFLLFAALFILAAPRLANAQTCGNGLCETGEGPFVCFIDCGDGSTCADGATNGFESDIDCGGPFCPLCLDGQACNFASDCLGAACIFGICQTATPAECGDGFCDFPEDGFSCPDDCGGGGGGGCGDGFCSAFETPFTCPLDCPFGSCGDGSCDPLNESTGSCAADCGFCGDSWCAPGENVFSCAADCSAPGICGNGICELPFEGPFTCPFDCVCAFGSADCDSDATCETFDSDGDGVICDDNCPATFNPTQSDWDGDMNGDACSPTSDCQLCVDTMYWDSNGAYHAASNQCSQLEAFDADNKNKAGACHAKCTALRGISSYLSGPDRQCLLDLCAGWDAQVDAGLLCVP